MRFFAFGVITMNILIVGNGFDLSHYLPTKYDHFMAAMGAVEIWDESKHDMEFDDLFRSLYEKEDYFFDYTKAMYDTDKIKISEEQINKLKRQLKENVWYQYFSDHVREVQTWIDFEDKINQALKQTADFISELENKLIIYGNFDFGVRELTTSNFKNEDQHYYLPLIKIEVLIILGLLEKNPKFEHQSGMVPEKRRAFINKKFYRVQEKEFYGFASEKYFEFLSDHLKDVIKLFNEYLTLVVNILNREKFKKLPIDNVEKVYSFNYTNTFQKFYNDKIDIEYLHGKFGEAENIVLGISDVKDKLLKKYKVYGFTKYHQKLLKNTDYLFLRESDKLKSMISSNSVGFSDINLFIWGHSLADSDEAYIQEIFSLNEKPQVKCIVIVFYYKNDVSKLLDNLLDILGKDKVETWMKKGWLKFEENPNIAEINRIKPVELLKFEEA